MTSFTDRHRELLFDYSLGLTSESEAVEAERLLAESPEAVSLYDTLRSVLSPLDALEVEPCPEELAERTVLRLRESSRAGSEPDRPDELVATGPVGPATVRIPFWRNWGDIAAVAAVLVLFVGIGVPTLGFARQKYWQARCQANLSGVEDGLASYVADNNGQLPQVATEDGAPWWKVGYQGPENHSNTRRGWVLVRQGYVPPSQFVCPARKIDGYVSFDKLKVEDYSDFPDRRFIGFSIRVGCPQSSGNDMTGRKVLIADLNPISEELPTDHSAEVNVRLCDKLLNANSKNHSGRGQNVLFSDGAVQFTRQRHTSDSDDDIYTLTGMSDGCAIKGYERPSCEQDAFLAP